MSTANLYSLNEATRLLKTSRVLVTMLVRINRIPYQLVGKAKVIDDASLELLRQAIVEYQSEPVSA